MAKGQISDQELESGLRAIGGFGDMAASGARRDSPFGAGFVAKSPPLVKPAVEPVMPVSAPKGSTEERQIRDDPLPLKPHAMKASRKTSSEPDEEEAGRRKGFGEKVTIQMSSAMRDDLNYLATKMQRRKTNRKQRITANTVMRVAIQFLLDELKLRESDIANSEDELLDLMKRKVLRESRS